MLLVQKYSLQIQTLSYSQAVIPLMAAQPAPDGCAVAIASDRCTVNLMLKVRRDPFWTEFLFGLLLYQHGLNMFVTIPPWSQGLIDVEKEVAKLDGKRAELEKQIEKLSDKISKGDYKEKVPVKVQEQDAEKVGGGEEHVTGLWMTKPSSGSSLLFTAPPEPNRAGKGERSHGQLQEDAVTLLFTLIRKILSLFLKSVHFITMVVVVLWREINNALVFCKMNS